LRPAVAVTRVIDRQDVRVPQPGGELDLALEALGTEGQGQLGMEDLERDRALVPDVTSQVYRGHTAASQLALEGIPASQRLRSASTSSPMRVLLGSRFGMSGSMP